MNGLRGALPEGVTPDARARRDRHRLGVPVRAGRQDRQARPRRAADVPGLHAALRAGQRARRRRGGERRRLPEAVPGHRRSEPPARLRRHARRGHRRHPRSRTTTSAAASSRCPGASTTSAGAATSRTSARSRRSRCARAAPAARPCWSRTSATVRFGPDIRRGLLEWNGEGEAVGGIVVMRYGENALDVIERVKKKIAELKPQLPRGRRADDRLRPLGADRARRSTR